MDLELLHRLDAELSGVPTSRRDALRKAGRVGAGAALSLIPFLASSKAVRAQNTLSDDVAILNYALTLEYLERSFYRQAIATGLIASGDLALFNRIRADEEAHVTLLRGALTGAGATPVTYDDSDFTFAPFLSSYANIKVLAQGLEDTGVRAYKGQAAVISTANLTTALQIHSVEARHAAAIRKLNGTTGWIPLAQPGAPGPIAPVYGAGNPAASFPSEANTLQGGVQLTTALSGYTAEEISEAFDEPLDSTTVFAIAGPFITGAPN